MNDVPRHNNRGARGIRTPDLLIANETRYQLRHSPKAQVSYHPGSTKCTLGTVKRTAIIYEY